MKQVFLKIAGRVQDVGFRWNSREKARELNLSGWVQNTSDDTVQILAQGSPENLEQFIAWAKTGPRFAGVAELKTEWQEPGEILSGFEIKR